MDDELQTAFNARNARRVWKYLVDRLKNGDPTEMQGIWDQIGELCLLDPDFFTDQIYFPVQYKVNKLPLASLFTMDRYILENYCLFPNEVITASIFGELKEDFAEMKDCRMYLTPYRLITSGVRIIFTRGTGSSWVGTAIAVSVNKKIQKALSQQFGELGNKGNYGYAYILSGVYKTKRSEGDISYNVAMEYEDKGEIKTQKLGIKIKPKQEKGEPKEEFLVKRADFLEKIDKSLTG